MILVCLAAVAAVAGGIWWLFRGAADAPVGAPCRRYEPELDDDLAERESAPPTVHIGE